MISHLYVHVPFCASICYYCDFCHTVYRKENVRNWLNAFKKELELRHPDAMQKTIYIGGGTPTCLSEEELEEFLSLLDPYTNGTVEYTIEVNPGTLTTRKAEMLARHGINRASIGLQSSDNEILKRIGRTHTFAETCRTVQLLKEYGIDNLSLDIMYSLPDSSMEDLQQTVKDAISLKPKHLSLYSLQVEENTVFGKRGIEPLDEDTEADMYEWICKTLPEHGFMQYEISNFAIPGFESGHNLAYWNYEDFYGFSAGASGKEGNIRYDITRNLTEYCKDPMTREDTILSEEDARFEMVMMSLRLKKGMNLDLFRQRFGISFEVCFKEKAEHLFREGLLEKKDGYVLCSDRGYEICNSILVDLL